MNAEPMPIGPRGTIFHSKPTRPGDGVSRRWRRTINGTAYSFTVVNMPNGDTRLIVDRHNGYPDMRFGCAWVSHKWITLKP